MKGASNKYYARRNDFATTVSFRYPGKRSKKLGLDIHRFQRYPTPIFSFLDSDLFDCLIYFILFAAALRLGKSFIDVADTFDKQRDKIQYEETGYEVKYA